MAERDLEGPQALIASLRGGDAPLEIRLFAARALLPLDREDQVRALLAVLEDPDTTTREAARDTFAATHPEELAHFLRDGAPIEMEIDILAHATEDPLVLEQVIRHKNVADATLEWLARTVTGGPQEALVVNQARLLRRPSLIDAMLENPALTADARRRLLEIREEFFEKEKRKQARAEQEAVSEAEAQAAADLAALSAEEAAAVTGGPAVADGADASLTTGAVYRRIAVMTVSQKIHLAYSGGKEERRILVGDANQLVGEAVLKSRGLTLPEIEAFCSMRHLHEDLFRKIGANREWMRHHGVVAALVRNPKVPLAITLPLVKKLPIRELKTVVHDPNLPEGVRVTARKWLTDKRR